MNGLCFDTTSSTWYGTSAYCLYIVDVTQEQPRWLVLRNLQYSIDISCDNDGNMYGYDVLWSGHSTLYSINKSTGQAIRIGDMGYGFVYAQDSAYDRDNGIFYVAGYFNDGNPSALLICDTQTGACTIVDNIPGRGGTRWLRYTVWVSESKSIRRFHILSTSSAPWGNGIL